MPSRRTAGGGGKKKNRKAHLMSVCGAPSSWSYYPINSQGPLRQRGTNSRHKSCLVCLCVCARVCVTVSLSPAEGGGVAEGSGEVGFAGRWRRGERAPNWITVTAGAGIIPPHKWLSAWLIDKLPLHFISQTDRA